jgi:dihydrolipoamide dehydrogenase
MSDERGYDVVVIGAGSTGENVASRAVAGGLSAAIAEADLVGGDCSYWACMPSKALLRPPEALDHAHQVPGVPGDAACGLDVAGVLANRDGFTSHWDDGAQASWLASVPIDLFRGRGRLDGPRRVVVTGQDGAQTVLNARHAVAVCTGTAPALPPVEGLADARPWTTKDATSAQQVPARLAILGGGVAGCEMADAYHALGAEVSVVEMTERLLGHYEPFVGDGLAASFRERGIAVRTSTSASRVQRGSEGVALTTDAGETIVADELLAAAGRKPRTVELGLDTVGLAPGAQLEVDDDCRVRGVDGGWLYAAGDVNGRALLTHMGKYQARVAGDAIAARANGATVEPRPFSEYAATADHEAVPQVVFTDPQVASVGRTEAQARDEGIDVRAVDYDLGSVAGAVLHLKDYAGHAKIVVDEAERTIVGATFLGPSVGELLHAATIAVVGKVPLDRLWHAVPSFPTISEVWLRLLETYGL